MNPFECSDIRIIVGPNPNSVLTLRGHLSMLSYQGPQLVVHSKQVTMRREPYLNIGSISFAHTNSDVS